MKTETRLFATEMAEAFDGAESCAWRIHHPGQLTIADYRSLDAVDPRHIHGLARVDPRRRPKVFGCIGLDDDGWLVRAELTYEDVAGLHQWPSIQALFALPYLRLVDERTGFAVSDRRTVRPATPGRAKVMDVPPPEACGAPESVRPDTGDTPPTTTE